MLYFKLLEDASAVDTRQKDMLRLELDLLHWMLGYTFDLLEDTSWGKCRKSLVNRTTSLMDTIERILTLSHAQWCARSLPATVPSTSEVLPPCCTPLQPSLLPDGRKGP